MMFFSRRLFSLPYMGESFNKTLFYLILSMARVSGGKNCFSGRSCQYQMNIFVYIKKGVFLNGVIWRQGAHGGGAFSGKDPTKVDRSAAYAARWVAKNVVAAGLASRCQIQLAYAIGVAQPLSVMVDTFGTGTVADDRLAAAVKQVFDLRPTSIIRDLDLRKPIYRQLAAYGHMGREELNVAWEKTDRIDALKTVLQQA